MDEIPLHESQQEEGDKGDADDVERNAHEVRQPAI
jgi:hypothetical protein